MQLILIVCGGRTFSDSDLLRHHLRRLGPCGIIHGGAPGADTLCGSIAKYELAIPVHVIRADWDRHGKAAGFIRNKQMLDLLLLYRENYRIGVLAMPGGNGTANMCSLARGAGVTVYDTTVTPRERLLELTAELKLKDAEHARHTEALRTELGDLVDMTQNTGHYPGPTVSEEEWYAAKALLHRPR